MATNVFMLIIGFMFGLVFFRFFLLRSNQWIQAHKIGYKQGHTDGYKRGQEVAIRQYEKMHNLRN